MTLTDLTLLPIQLLISLQTVMLYGLSFGFPLFYSTYTIPSPVDKEKGATCNNRDEHSCCGTILKFNLRAHVCSWKATRLLAMVVSGALSATLLKADVSGWMGSFELSMICHSMALSFIALVFSSVFITFFDGLDRVRDAHTQCIEAIESHFSWTFSIIFAIPAVCITWSAAITLCCVVLLLTKEYTPCVPAVSNEPMTGLIPLDIVSRITLFALLGIVTVLLVFTARRLSCMTYIT
ncbi:hypothetical protein AMATHDRAFT_64394 [Amanita thiersii Skay4041]|uniref:Transmembrane protein n=1 Tax=Amanita thiersii Skay4041 TaxID=703135 RepID=A0A2A9NFN0_9AGAR|nr:hypothetical protein AMATHDRAFT_64394 [Amanita thiersii Skay4041]